MNSKLKIHSIKIIFNLISLLGSSPTLASSEIGLVGSKKLSVLIEEVRPLAKAKNFDKKDALKWENRVETMAALEMFLKQSYRQRDYLVSLILHHPHDAHLEKWKKQLGLVENEITNAKIYASKREASEGWFKSSYFRDIVTENGSFAIAAENYIPALINFRKQTIEDVGGHHRIRMRRAGKKQSWQFLRLGVISDLSNGYTNLAELVVMEKNPKLRDIRLAELENLKESLEAKANKKSMIVPQLAGVEFALSELRDLPNTLIKRRTILQTQALQLVQKQMEERYHGHDAEFSMVHLSLLRESDKKVSANGWIHAEANRMLDMAEIFKEIDQSKIIIDSHGPFVDADGNFHINLPGRGKKLQTVKLNAFFFNVSTREGKAGREVERKINTESLERYARANATSKTEELRKLIFESGQYGFLGATEVGKFFLQSDIATSIGCLSAKDRTAMVSAMIVRDFTGQGHDDFLSSLADDNGIAHQIVKENSPNNSGKVKAAFLPLLSKESSSKTLGQVVKHDLAALAHALREKISFTSTSKGRSEKVLDEVVREQEGKKNQLLVIQEESQTIMKSHLEKELSLKKLMIEEVKTMVLERNSQKLLQLLTDQRKEEIVLLGNRVSVTGEAFSPKVKALIDEWMILYVQEKTLLAQMENFEKLGPVKQKTIVIEMKELRTKLERKLAEIKASTDYSLITFLMNHLEKIKTKAAATSLTACD
jgi:hypothetical protein